MKLSIRSQWTEGGISEEQSVEFDGIELTEGSVNNLVDRVLGIPKGVPQPSETPKKQSDGFTLGKF